ARFRAARGRGGAGRRDVPGAPRGFAGGLGAASPGGRDRGRRGRPARRAAHARPAGVPSERHRRDRPGDLLRTRVGRVQLSLTDPSWLVFSGGFDATPLRRFSKRCSDLLIATLVLLLT